MKSGSLSDRDRLILAHIGRHWLSFKEIIGHLFFANDDPRSALDDLRGANLIASHKGLVGNRAMYQLTSRGATAAHLNRRRGLLMGTESIAAHLAILGFCFLKQRRRISLEPGEFYEIFGVQASPNRHHVLEFSSYAKRVYCVSVPGATTRPEDVIQSARRWVADSLRVREIRPWIKYRLYAYAVLVDNRERQNEIASQLEQASYVEGKTLVSAAQIMVEIVPGAHTLEDSLSVFKKEAQKA
ncbi:MAG: hypothetical protein DCC65_10690 [Planctomycetota bacterium]|nr:MAG: hypothetical protein DCC65_10690 [Planctomycetota bacterium]